MENDNFKYVYSIFIQEENQEVLAIAEILRYQGNRCLDTKKKVCLNLERLSLTPRLLYYELTNGFPSYPPFDPKDFGGYTYNEILDRIEVSDLWKIAEYEVGIDYGNVCFYFDYMNEKTRKLFEDTMQIIVEESQFSKGNTHCKGVVW